MSVVRDVLIYFLRFRLYTLWLFNLGSVAFLISFNSWTKVR